MKVFSETEGKRKPFGDKTNFIMKTKSPSSKCINKYVDCKVLLELRDFSTKKNDIFTGKTRGIIASDFKFKLIPKVHVYRCLNSLDRMPNMPSIKMTNQQIILKNGFSKINGDLYSCGLNQVCNTGQVVKSNDQIIPKHTKRLVINVERNIELEKIIAKLKPIRTSNVSNTVKENTIIVQKNNIFNKKAIVKITKDKKLELAFKKSQNLIKKVCFSDSSPKFEKALRKRKQTNYAEVSINGSSKDSPYKEHLPVYFHNTANKKKLSRKDPFEFFSDSLKKNGPGRTRLKNPRKYDSPESSDYDDESMHKVLQKLRTVKSTRNKKQENKKQKVTIKPVTSSRKKQLNNDEIVFANNVVNDNKEVHAKRKENKVTGLPNTEDTQLVPTGTLRKTSGNVNIAECEANEADDYFGFEDELDLDEVPLVAHSDWTKKTPHSPKFIALTSTPIVSAQNKPVTSSNKINIISNIQISAPREITPSVIIETPQNTPINDKATNPLVLHNKNSTILKPTRSKMRYVTTRKLQKQNATPWRSDKICLVRNPHFLSMKETSLPSYNQQMVLEPRLLERPVNLEKPEVTKAQRQTTMLDFVDSSDLRALTSTPSKDRNNLTLFDENNFSPIKDNRETTPTKKDKPVLGKRNILETNRSPLKSSNTLNVDENHVFSTQVFNVDNYFGFDSVDGKENRVYQKKKKGMSPMRLPLLMKVQDRSVMDDVFDEEKAKDVPEEMQEKIKSTVPVSDSDASVVGIFQDLREVKPRRIYERRKPRRARVHSSDSEAETKQAHNQKRKALRSTHTVAEQKEYDAWIARFNSMCNEVDLHSLEIA